MAVSGSVSQLKFAANAGKKAGEFYTPPEVSDLIAELLDPQPGDSICDPACGSGSLLMKCGRKVVANHGSKQYALYGQEAIGSTWSLAKMNMFLHGEDNHKIEWGDTIRNPKLLDKNGDLILFDIVTANPPFSLDKWGHDEAEHDKFSRFRRGLPPRTKGDYAFILHMIETMKPGTGRMAVVVPHGVLFRGGEEREPLRPLTGRRIVAAHEEREDHSRDQRQEGDDREKLVFHSARPLLRAAEERHPGDKDHDPQHHREGVVEQIAGLRAACEARGIPWLRLNNASLIQLGMPLDHATPLFR